MLFSEPLLRHLQGLSHYFHAGLVKLCLQRDRSSSSPCIPSQTCLYVAQADNASIQAPSQVAQQQVEERTVGKANVAPKTVRQELKLEGETFQKADVGGSVPVYTDDDKFFTVIISVLKIVTCFSTMLLTTMLWTIVMLFLLPFPYARIKQGNVYGHVTGRILMWILGNPIKMYGTENAGTKAIYVCNHASPLDIFLVMWLTPTGTVGIAKKEIIWYPLFGQLYVLANHLRIDRTNSVASIQSMRKVAKDVVDKNLSVIVFPEGTRSKTGRLLPFKKGFVHLALQTKLPIVPMVLTGTHQGWQKNSLRVRPAPLTVTYLPPIKTEDWTVDKVEHYVAILHALFAKHLPPSQKPMEAHLVHN